MSLSGRILVVDHEQVIRELLVDILSEKGYAVTAVASGAEALETIREDNGYDLLMVELFLPGLPGLGLIREARKYDPTLSFVAMTAHETPRLALEVFREGVEEWLSKPFSLEELNLRVVAALASRREAESRSSRSKVPDYVRKVVSELDEETLGSEVLRCVDEDDLHRLLLFMELRRAPTADRMFLGARQDGIGEERYYRNLVDRDGEVNGLRHSLSYILLALGSRLSNRSETLDQDDWASTYAILNRLLAEDTGVLFYFQLSDCLVVVAITAAGHMISALPYKSGQLLERMQCLLRRLESSGIEQTPDYESRPPQLTRDLGAAPGNLNPDTTLDDLSALDRDLFAPVAKHLYAVKRLCIVPHGPTMLCPFAALKNTDGSHLVERYELFYAPSLLTITGVLERDRVFNEKLARGLTPYRKEGRATFIGDPDRSLAGAERECRALCGLLGDDMLLLHEDATIESLKVWGTAFSRCKLLHLACHGKYNAKRPTLSYLQMSPHGRDDGRLLFREIPYLDIRADLVTLSACSTAASETMAQNEVNCLALAFLIAGARSVIAAQWRVHDEYTPVFMQNLYKGITRENASKCLQTAMIQAIRDHVHPFVWAPFVAMGAPYSIEAGETRFYA